MLRQKHGAVVLLLLWAEAAAALRSLRYRDMAWLGLGGGGLLIYAVAAIVGRFHVAAPLLRHDPLRAAAVAAIIALLVGLLSGLAVARLALSRALRAFLLVQPVRFQALIHSAAVATAMLGVTLALASGFIVALAAGSAGVLLASLVSVAWTLAFAAGFAVGAALRISGARAETDRWSARNPTSAGLHLRPLATLDAAAPRWLGSWSWGLAPGQLRLSAVQALLLAIILIASAFAAATGLVQHEVLPASFAAVIGGLLIFMLSLSCRPLGSPVLRTAPLGFAKAWLRLLLLPLLLSLTFFVLPAGAAVAAEPGNWAVPAQAGLGLLLLNGLYAVFAACFLQSPLVASLSFLGALGYFSWQSVDLGRTVYFGLAVLIGWLWYRARRRYRHG